MLEPVVIACLGGCAVTAFGRGLIGLLPRHRRGERAKALRGRTAALATLFRRLLDRLHGPLSRLRRREVRRLVEAGLEAVIGEIVQGLRAGESLYQALHRTAATVAPPWDGLLNQVIRRYEGGASLAEALVPLSDAGGRGTGLFVGALTIHQQWGGDLGDALTNLAATVREDHFRGGELWAKTAEVRWTAAILAGTPLLLLLYFLIAAPDVLSPLRQEAVGRIGVLYGLGSWLTGLVLIARLVGIGRAGGRP